MKNACIRKVLIITLVSISLTSFHAVSAKAQDDAGTGLSKLSLVPPRKDWLLDKRTLVLLQGKETTVTCDGNLRFVVIADEDVVKVKEPEESPDKSSRPCKFTLKGIPKTGHTNLIVATTNWSYHRNLEIRGKTAKDYVKAEKLYKSEVKLTDPDPVDSAAGTSGR